MSRASSIASFAVSTPARLRPVSHSMTTPSGRPAISAACGRPSMMVGLSAATVIVGALQQPAEPAHLLLAQQIVADEDVVEAAVDHHLGLAELLAGDALGAGRHLHLGEHRALVRLDVRPVGDAAPRRTASARGRCCARPGRDRSPPPACRTRARSAVLRVSMLIGAFLPAIQACCAFEASCAIARQAPRLNSRRPVQLRR